MLPPDYKEGTRYPTVLDAYPLDYTDKEVAGQVRNTSQTFTSTWGADARLYALAGYVVLYNTAIPIVGPATSAYDSYTEQLVASAKAAIDKAVELGVTDPDRVGVIGHSHGALMVANLLARSTLFKAGIARSGAYNKTLTMFGFQNERRTLWEGRDVYLDVSPLFFADKINSPLLLIHGDLDQNPGTTPIQSERMYEAVRGVGGTTRLVMLPFEGHGYRSLESVQHVLYEMVRWFDMYVK
ncbi:MAG: prolyl oligopeptidase family serine peptidase [Deltaproteobacteria bacterium]|nr:prolyl oligopeptidase family serine peptidase [Deltaproteobacteria bacterium]